MINQAQVVAELTALHEQYEKALVTNDVETLIRFFWDSPHALRFGVNEALYGAKEIEEFRVNRPSVDLAREVLNLKIVTFGLDTATVTLEFKRTVQGSPRHGRQSQVWRKFDDGWKIVSAHVSLIPVPYIDQAAPLMQLSIPSELREGVQQNIARSAQIVKPLLDYRLDPQSEAAPIFIP